MMMLLRLYMYSTRYSRRRVRSGEFVRAATTVSLVERKEITPTFTDLL